MWLFLWKCALTNLFSSLKKYQDFKNVHIQWGEYIFDTSAFLTVSVFLFFFSVSLLSGRLTQNLYSTQIFNS